MDESKEQSPAPEVAGEAAATPPIPEPTFRSLREVEVEFENTLKLIGAHAFQMAVHEAECNRYKNKAYQLEKESDAIKAKASEAAEVVQEKKENRRARRLARLNPFKKSK